MVQTQTEPQNPGHWKNPKTSAILVPQNPSSDHSGVATNSKHREKMKISKKAKDCSENITWQFLWFIARTKGLSGRGHLKEWLSFRIKDAKMD